VYHVLYKRLYNISNNIIFISKKFSIEKLRGKWVVIFNKHIIASGKDIKKILKEAEEKHSKGDFILAQVPEKGTMIC
jgi:hypothetical protein